MHRYRMKYRPPGFATLPKGLNWNMVENGIRTGFNRPDLPMSIFPFGIFETDRPLNPEELRDYEIEKTGD